MERYAILAAVVLFILLGLVLPAIRLHRRTGTYGIVLQRDTRPLQRAMALTLALALLGTVAWGTLQLVTPADRLGIWSVPSWLRGMGWGLMAGGLMLLMAAQAQMGTSWRVGIDPNPTGLVTTGLFRWIRNPIYTAISTMLMGLFAVTPSPWTLAIWAASTLAVTVQARLEEQHLLSAHGAAYRQYAARVGRFFPGIGMRRLPS